MFVHLRSLPAAVVLLLFTGLLSGCTGLALGPFAVSVTEADIEQHLRDYFPLRRAVHPFFEVAIEGPRVALSASDGGRVNVGLDLSVGTGAGATQRSWRGGIDISGGIRYEPATREIFLRNPAVNSLAIEGLDGARRTILANALNVILTAIYQDKPIYRLSDDHFTRGGRQFALNDIEVREGEIAFLLKP